jgi:hypothetical protein
MLAFLKKNKTKLVLVASLGLNVLGGAGVIPPVLAQALAAVFGSF